jgi:hypothetical protein
VGSKDFLTVLRKMVTNKKVLQHTTNLPAPSCSADVRTLVAILR